jgi:hypothetical protein
MRRSALALLVCCGGLAACVMPEDNPTTVKDLRVLAVRFEPPEVMLRACTPRLLGALAAGADGGMLTLPPDAQAAFGVDLGRPVTMTALIADPAGNGRSLTYRVLACANTSDRLCVNEGDSVELDGGVQPGGELTVQLQPGVAQLPDRTLLIQEVISQDTFRGLGGFRVPVVLDVQTADGSERVYAQKLMVYMCQFFPEMRANQTPVLPGVRIAGQPWPEGEVKTLSGTAPVQLEPEDFSALQETYVLPNFALSPVELRESWKVSWYTSMGTMSSATTGGVNFAGEAERQRSTWQPDTTLKTPQDVTFTLVVRDGRGGTSWLQRRARWTP